MSSHAALSLLLIISLSFKLCNCTRNTTILCPATEKQSLLTFKKSLQDPREHLSSWDADVDCCKWKGIVCNNLTGHVLELHLRDKDLRGKIDPSLLKLKHLALLDLSGNPFEGSISGAISNLTSLEVLDLSLTQFVVDSLEWLLELPELEYFNMNGVNLSRAVNWAKGGYQEALNF